MESKATPTSRLLAVDFAADLRRLTTDFTGRAWVFDEIDRWMADGRGAALLLLTGEPGVGKSAIAARVVQTRADVVAYHFCIAGRNETIVPSTVLRSLAAQLGEKLPDYGTALANAIKPTHLTVNVNIDVQTMTGGQITGVVIEHLTALDPQTELEVLLRAPLAALPVPERPLLVVIDSLDEAATLRSDPTLVSLLSGLNGLSGWLRVLCTSRSELRVLSYFDRWHPYTLAAESSMNLDDIRQYVTNRLRKAALKEKLSAAGQPEAAFITYRFYSARLLSPLTVGDNLFSYSYPPMQLWLVNTATSQAVFAQVDPGRIVSIAADADIVLVSRGDRAKEMEVWDCQKQARLMILPNYRREVGATYTTPVITPDGRAVLTADFDHYLVLWDPTAPGEIALQPTRYKTVDISANGEWAAVLGESSKIDEAWDLETGQVLPKSTHDDVARAILQEQAPYQSSPVDDNETANSRFIDKERALFKDKRGKNRMASTSRSDEKTSMKKMAEPEGAAKTAELHLTHDGRYAVSASEDRTVRLWDQATGECLAVYTNDIPMLNQCAVSNDGRRIAALDVLGRVHLLELEGRL